MQFIDPNLEFQQQEQAVLSQKRLADILRKKADKSVMPDGKMVGGQYIPPSTFEYMVPGAQEAAARKAEQASQQAEQDYAGRVGQAQNDWRSSLPQARAAQAEQAGPVDPNNPTELDAQAAQPVTGAQVLKHTLAGMRIPGLDKEAAVYSQTAQGEITREDTQTARREDLAANNAAKAEIAAKAAEAKREDSLRRSEDTRLSIEQRAQAAEDATAARREYIVMLGKVAELSAGKKSAPKPMPAGPAKAWRENQVAMKKVQAAIDAVKANPNSFGAKFLGPDFVNSRMDPAGVTARAKVADVGSFKLHERSGANVTTSEAPRLMPFIPNSHSRAEDNVKKLENLMQEYQYVMDEITAEAEAYNYILPGSGAPKDPGAATPPATPGAGGAAPSAPAAAPPVRVGTPAEAAKLPMGTKFVTPDGQVRVRQ